MKATEQRTGETERRNRPTQAAAALRRSRRSRRSTVLRSRTEIQMPIIHLAVLVRPS
jgi:hypothetical protein